MDVSPGPRGVAGGDAVDGLGGRLRFGHHPLDDRADGAEDSTAIGGVIGGRGETRRRAEEEARRAGRDERGADGRDRQALNRRDADDDAEADATEARAWAREARRGRRPHGRPGVRRSGSGMEQVEGRGRGGVDQRRDEGDRVRAGGDGPELAFQGQ